MFFSSLPCKALPMKRARVLLLDDDTLMRDLAETVLVQVGGFHVRALASGEHTLSHVHSYAPDVILLDVVMPSPNGREVLAMLQKDNRACSVPVCFLTATPSEKERAELLALGASCVFEKPFQVRALCEDIARLVAHSQATLPSSGNAKRTAVQESLKAQMGEDAFCELEKAFLRQMQDSVADLQRAIQGMSLETAARVSHSLRSSCTLFGEVTLAQACQRVEMALSWEASEHEVNALFSSLKSNIEWRTLNRRI